MRTTGLCITILCALFLPWDMSRISLAHAYTSPGSPTGYVNDFAGVLSPEERSQIESILTAFQASTTNQVTVVIISTLGDDYIENFALKLFEEWGIGGKERDNGILLLIAMSEKKMRIEVGYGLEGALTDAQAGSIIRNDLTPLFQAGKFGEGIALAVSHIILATQGEYIATETDTAKPSSGLPFEAWLFFFIFGFQALSALLGRSKSWWLGGILGGVLGGVGTFLGLFGLTLAMGGFVTVVLVLIGLVFDFIVSRGYQKGIQNGGHIPWWAGGSSSGGGGGSFGGFGGGSSGGGGASGSW